MEGGKNWLVQEFLFSQWPVFLFTVKAVQEMFYSYLPHPLPPQKSNGPPLTECFSPSLQGAKRFTRDIHVMTDRGSSVWWVISWKFTSILVTLVSALLLQECMIS